MPHKGTVRALARQARITKWLHENLALWPCWRALELLSAELGVSTRTVENDLKTIVGRGHAHWHWSRDSAHDRPVRHVRWRA